MKIECPSCQLTGNINELEIPPDGRHVNCPRCRESFRVKKPAATTWQPYMMNVCPKCQYSTFSEEMFAVCPKCGLDGSSHHASQQKAEKTPPLSQQEFQQQLLRDQERLQRTYRNPDLNLHPTAEPEEEAPQTPMPVRVTGWVCMALAAALLCYGLAGLLTYYGKDWQAELSATTLEPVAKSWIFFSLGLAPWLITLYGAILMSVATLFLRVWGKARIWLEVCAWGGMGVGAMHELINLVSWIRNSSSSPTFSYYLIGIINTIFMIALWVAPFLALLWYVRSDAIRREFPQ